MDLLVATAPRICKLFPNVRFVIGQSNYVPMSSCHLYLAGGDGPKMIDLLQMREKFQLQDRIELLGPVKHSDVRSVSTLLRISSWNVAP